jgi:ribosome recycling factor
MAQGKKKPNMSKLKGIKLYNFLLKELGEQNKKTPAQQRLGIETRRKIVSETLYPKFKKEAKLSIRAIRKDIKEIVKALPPKEICHPLYLAEAYLANIEYYELDNHIRSVLPDCLDIMVNAGYLGKTKIFNTRGYSYYSDGVRRIIENIREELRENKSGLAYFDGIPKLKYRKPNNGQAENYYIEFVLYINDIPEVDDSPVDFDLPNREQKKADKVKTYLSKRFATLQKEKRKRKRQAKKALPKTEKQKKQQLTKELRIAINALKRLLKDGQISKDQFEKQKASLMGLKAKKP